MPTVFGNSFEGGTDGVAITTGNSGGASGTAFDAISGAGFKYSAAEAISGSMGALVAAGVAGAGEYNLANVSHVAAQVWFTPKATATADEHLIRVANSGTRLFSVHISAPGSNTGKLRIDDSTGTSGEFTFANALVVGTHYRLEIYIVFGSSTSNGTIKAAYYIGNSTTPVETVHVNNAANLGAGLTANQLYMGKFSITSEAYGFDGMYYSVDATDFIGVATGTPPTVSTPAIQNVAAGAAVTVSVTASSTSGTIASYAWSYLYPTSGGPTLSGTTTNTLTFTAGSMGDLYQLQCVVTDSNGLTTTVATEVRVPTTGDAVPLPGNPIANVGAWSNVGGAATPGTAVGDSSDTTYIESPTLSSTEQKNRYRLQPMTARSALTITIRLEQDTSGTTTAKARLFEGAAATLRQTDTPTLTTAWADYPMVIASPGAITDWGYLAVEGGATSP